MISHTRKIVSFALKLAGTVSITLTGVVFVVLLAPVLGDKSKKEHSLCHYPADALYRLCRLGLYSACGQDGKTTGSQMK